MRWHCTGVKSLWKDIAGGKDMREMTADRRGQEGWIERRKAYSLFSSRFPQGLEVHNGPEKWVTDIMNSHTLMRSYLHHCGRGMEGEDTRVYWRTWSWSYGRDTNNGVQKMTWRCLYNASVFNDFMCRPTRYISITVSLPQHLLF